MYLPQRLRAANERAILVAPTIRHNYTARINRIQHMTWLYQDTPIETLPEECVGFVYCITNNLSGRKYIGKKLAKFSKTTYKTVTQKNGNKKRKIYDQRSIQIGESTMGQAQN
jgi:hypothetical protein